MQEKNAIHNYREKKAISMGKENAIFIKKKNAVYNFGGGKCSTLKKTN